MSLQELLADLRRARIQISLESEQLKVRAPAGSLTDERRALLRLRKPEIVEFLKAAAAVVRQPPAIIPLQPNGARPPVFAVAGHNGDVFTYREFAGQLGADQPFYGLQPPGLDGRQPPLDTVPALAAYFADQIQAFRPRGPYVIAGFCAGGTVACELAGLLERRGQRVALLAMFACPYPVAFTGRAQVLRSLTTHARRLWAAGSWRARREYVAAYRRRRAEDRATRQAAAADPTLRRRAAVEAATLAGVRRHTPTAYGGAVAFFLPGASWRHGGFWVHRWRRLLPRLEEYVGDDCSMDVMLRGDDANVFVEHFRHARARHVDALDGFGASEVQPAGTTPALPTLATSA